jgi:transcriptional regulator with PAS, ATPase and Fis domain
MIGKSSLHSSLSIALSAPIPKRREDIPLLVEYLLKGFAEKLGKRIGKIHRSTTRTLELWEALLTRQ